jgi:hypothetical protein
MTDVLMNCNLLAEKVKSFFGLWWKIGIVIPWQVSVLTI